MQKDIEETQRMRNTWDLEAVENSFCPYPVSSIGYCYMGEAVGRPPLQTSCPAHVQIPTLRAYLCDWERWLSPEKDKIGELRVPKTYHTLYASSIWKCITSAVSRRNFMRVSAQLLVHFLPRLVRQNGIAILLKGPQLELVRFVWARVRSPCSGDPWVLMSETVPPKANERA